MFERFTEKAIKVIMLAQEEARRLGHNHVGTEQILLGLIGEKTGIAGRSLNSVRIRLKDARTEVEKRVGRGNGFVAVEIPFTPRAKRTLELSWEAAKKLARNYIDTEHLLLAIIQQEESIGYAVLKDMGVNLDELEQLILKSVEVVPTKADPQGTNPSPPAEASAASIGQTRTPFERFTEKGIKVIMLAQEEARRLGLNRIGTEQILLGLIGEGTGIAAKTLKSSGVNLKDARVEVEKLTGRGSGFVAVEIPFTEAARRALEASSDAARKLGHNYVGTEHLLLGLLTVDDLGCTTLKNLGIDLDELRKKVLRLLGTSKEEIIPKIPDPASKPDPKESYPLELILWLVIEVLGTAKEFALRSKQQALATLLLQHETRLTKELEFLGFLKPTNESKTSTSNVYADATPFSPIVAGFLPPAANVIMLAQEEARRLGHNFVGTEQILIGLIGEGSGIGFVALKDAGVNLENTRIHVEKIIGRGSGYISIDIPFTPRCKRVLELTWDEARQLGHSQVRTEHLLLGLLREGEGVAARVLENLGVDKHKLRSRVLELVTERGDAK
jgi:ATP-dependent Clp protease ATP-binding subunit ClpA